MGWRKKAVCRRTVAGKVFRLVGYSWGRKLVEVGRRLGKRGVGGGRQSLMSRRRRSVPTVGEVVALLRCVAINETPVASIPLGGDSWRAVVKALSRIAAASLGTASKTTTSETSAFIVATSSAAAIVVGSTAVAAAEATTSAIMTSTVATAAARRRSTRVGRLHLQDEGDEGVDVRGGGVDLCAIGLLEGEEFICIG